MYLRKLEKKDATLMLSWMHDESVVQDLNTMFTTKTLQDCENFIINSQKSYEMVHYAIASDEDEYMGTVSLKYINNIEKNAEFAITIRKEAMGRGYSWFAMKEIIDKAFIDYGLESIYWCVSRANERAVRFYDKHHFHERFNIPTTAMKRYEGIENLKWYSLFKGEVQDIRDTVAGCRIVHIKSISTENAGELSFFEGTHDIPFDIKRIYYISKVPEGVRRGFHAHKKLKQLIFCPFGRIQLILEGANKREEIELSSPSIGVIIDKPIWREMLWLQKNSILCVAASDYFEEEDYIRDYTQFKNYVGGN